MGARRFDARRVLLAMAAVALGWACALAAITMPVEAGRASFQVPDDQVWRVHTFAVTDLEIGGDMQSQMKVGQTALWLLSGPTDVQAVLVFEGSKYSSNGATLMQWGESCKDQKTSERMFVRNRWINMWSQMRDDCLVVSGPWDLAGSLEAVRPEVAKALQQAGALFQGSGYVVQARVAQEGTFLNAWLLVREGFEGSPRVPSILPAGTGLSPAIVQWGIELSDAIKESTLSFSGKLDLPRVNVRP